jgi:N6-L-threonylcarbamoyladenine synthase
VARLLGLGFPGGPALDAAARTRDGRGAVPRAMEGSGDLDFSMSGLKTAVLRHVQAERAAEEDRRPGSRRELPEAIVDVQVAKTLEAARRTRVSRVLLGGGVVAEHAPARAPASRRGRGGPRCECAAAAAVHRQRRHGGLPRAARLERGDRTGLDIAADPNLPLAM